MNEFAIGQRVRLTREVENVYLGGTFLKEGALGTVLEDAQNEGLLYGVTLDDDIEQPDFRWTFRPNEIESV